MIAHGTKSGIVALSLALAACGSFETRDGGPAQPPFDLDRVSDAVPRVEPLSRYGNPESYTVLGKTYHTLKSSNAYIARGHASWYGEKFHGRRTSSGEPYDMYAMTAAHKTLPLPTYVEVTNLENGRKVVVKVNDRGPFHEGRIIDLSYTAAYKLGFLGRGTAAVEVRAIDPGMPAPGDDDGSHYIQVGAFKDRVNAEDLFHRLKQAAMRPKIMTGTQGATLYRVQVGPFVDQAQAEQASLKLAELGYMGFKVIIEQSERN